MGEVIRLEDRMSKPEWARACATACMLAEQEAERRAAKRARMAPWASLKAPPAAEQLELGL